MTNEDLINMLMEHRKQVEGKGHKDSYSIYIILDKSVNILIENKEKLNRNDGKYLDALAEYGRNRFKKNHEHWSSLVKPHDEFKQAIKESVRAYVSLCHEIDTVKFIDLYPQYSNGG